MSRSARGEGRGGTDPRRTLPAMDRLLAAPETGEWAAAWGREPVKAAVRAALEEARTSLAAGASPPDAAGILARAEEILRRAARPALRRVLNATGVVLHTNLGRAPLAEEAAEAVRSVALGYTNLEYDVEAGTRGSRYDHCTDLLCELTGSGAALVVNNNAAAVALVANELARDREVVISRGELVEIGGSFRIPEVLERAGAVLVEVGTTNRTRIDDYRRALGPRTALLLKVHPSNYAMRGYVAAVELELLVALGRESGVPVAHDLGSGLLLPGALSGFPPEPSPGGSVQAGADVVTWSGDKLLGGPQAGILHGSPETIARLRRNPLLRAFRVDRMTIAALEATLRLYRDPGRAAERIPVLAMLLEPLASVERRAREALPLLGAAAPRVAVRRMTSVVGGGAYPGHEIPSAGWAVSARPEEVERRCRLADPPLIGRLEEGELRLDFRTLRAGDAAPAARILAHALGGADEGGG